MSVEFNAGRILKGLKDFQRATVEHAFHRLFDAPDSTRRFLVADEVGLGKTMVARGVVAKTIDRLSQDGVERIDIVYICSNGDIAAQNVRKLDVTGTGAARASRLTLLAKQVRDLREQSLNLVALTPGTSFEQSGGAGRADERVLLYWLLREAWSLGDRAWPKNVLQGWVRSADDFRYRLRAFDRTQLDTGIVEEFQRTLDHRIAKESAAGYASIRQRFDDLSDEFGRARARVPLDQTRRRDALIGELRGLLAAACVEALEPDLVILDEFQRFRHLLADSDSEAANLARALFEWERPQTGEHARVLMLSATPYRALTVAGDGGDDNHHEDFLATVRFLADSEACADELRGLLREYQGELYGCAPEASDRLQAVATAIEDLLGRYIARTERIGAAGQHDAMLRHVPRVASPTPADLHQYLLAQDVAHQLEQHDVTELWKSAPYLLNFLDGYTLRSRFDTACKAPDQVRELASILNATKADLLDRARVRAYDDVDPGGPRMRELAKDVIDSEAWRLLWIPPSMPYHELGGRLCAPTAARLHEAAGLLRLARRSARSGWLTQLSRRATLESRGGLERTEHARTSRESAQPARIRDRSERTAHRHACARVALPIAHARGYR